MAKREKAVRHALLGTLVFSASITFTRRDRFRTVCDTLRRLDFVNLSIGENSALFTVPIIIATRIEKKFHDDTCGLHSRENS